MFADAVFIHEQFNAPTQAAVQLKIDSTGYSLLTVGISVGGKLFWTVPGIWNSGEVYATPVLP